MLYDLLMLSAIFSGIVVAIVIFKVHPFIVLILAGLLLGIVGGLSPEAALAALMNGLANTFQWVGVIMLLGTVVGELLNRSGGAARLARSFIAVTGTNRLPIAMGMTGYFISIPIFVDVAYIVLQPVTEALSTKGRGILPIGLSLAAGLTATHALLPPTPGPLAIASILEADLGRMILINSVVALFVIAGGIGWAVYGCRKKIPYDDVLAARYQAPEDTSERPTGSFKFLLPIILPLLLVALASFVKDTEGVLASWIVFLGHPVMALLLGVAVALLVVGWKKGYEKNLWETSISKSAEVILITAAGGALGNVIKESAISEAIVEGARHFQAVSFLFPFVLAAILTTATGSITVSTITTASLIAPLVGELPVSKEMTAALIGSGAFCVFHVNASFFWLLNRLHNIPVNVLLRTFTLQSFIMGLSGLLGVFVLWLLGVR